MGFKVAGSGSALPNRVVPNDAMEAELGLEPGWIQSRTGVHSRRMAGPSESSGSLGVAAARIALERAGSPSVDIVLCATFTPDYGMCPMAPGIATACGIRSALAFDFNAACCGSVVGIMMAIGAIESRLASRVLLVCSDTTTRFLRDDDADTRSVFGDGAAALVIADADVGEPGSMRVDARVWGSDGCGAGWFRLENEGSVPRATPGRERTGGVVMNGRALFKFAVTRGVALVNELCNRAKLRPEDVDWVLVHEANARIVDGIVAGSRIPVDRWTRRIHETGNLAGTSVAYLLADRIARGGFGKGQHVLLGAFGAGVSWAGLALTVVGP
jgi:3-oxoacyl-[acyl-carrier-protein] synthase-3